MTRTPFLTGLCLALIGGSAAADASQQNRNLAVHIVQRYSARMFDDPGRHFEERGAKMGHRIHSSVGVGTRAPALVLTVSAASVGRADPIPREVLQVLSADAILTGRITRVETGGAGGRVDLHLVSPRILKGERSRKPSEVRIIVERPSSAGFTRADLDRLKEETVLVFAIDVDDPGVEQGFYLERGAWALQPQQEQVVAAVEAEIDRQGRLLAGFAESAYARPDKTDRAVKEQLDHLTKPSAQHAVDRLLAMGCRSVPALVRQMDDQRRYGGGELTLPNQGSFEAISYYGPKLVVDAVAVILNELISVPFGYIFNGASPRTRARAVERARTWLALSNGRAFCPPR